MNAKNINESKSIKSGELENENESRMPAPCVYEVLVVYLGYLCRVIDYIDVHVSLPGLCIVYTMYT